MEDCNSKQKNKEKNNSSNKISSQTQLKMKISENKLIINKINKKGLERKKSQDTKLNSNFYNKRKFSKDKTNLNLNISVKEDNRKKKFSFKSSKIIRNSLSRDLITKILEMNNEKSSFKNDNSSYFLCQKEESFSNNINSILSFKIHDKNNPNITEYKEQSKINNKRGENNKIQETFSHIKNKNIRKMSKNKKNSICGAGTQDFRKNRNIKLDSGTSITDNQNENEYKYNSSISNSMKDHFKKADIFFDLNQINGNNNNQQLTFRVFSQNNSVKTQVSQQSNLNNDSSEYKYNMLKRQKELAHSIIELDLAKLQKEIYEYENTDVTDAINRLPTHKFSSDKNNNKNKNSVKIYKTKNNKGKKIKSFITNIKEKFRILRRVGYVYDSLDDEECEEEDNNFYFEPKSNFILILDSLILVTSLFDLIYLPIHLSSSSFNEKNLIKSFFFIFIDIIFIIDLISGFFKSYINFDEDLIKNNVLIIRNYLKTWFLLDFLCGIPVYSILKASKDKFEYSNNSYDSCYFNYSDRSLYRLFELIKLLKIIKVLKANIGEEKIKHIIKKINFFYYWGYFIKQVFIFISILNLSSCLFIFSARNNYPNWIINLNMNINNFIPIYICSFYYIITTITTVGYGDIQIFSMTERVFEILFLIIGTCLYSWMLTSASNYIKKMSEKNLKFEQNLEILDDIKKNYPLMSPDLYRRIYKLLYYKKFHQEIDKNIIIDLLPYSIRNDLLIQMYYPIIKNFKFFKYFGNSEFIIEIVSVLKPLVGMKGDLLINEGDYVEDIILNKSGVLSLEICIDLYNPYEFIEKYLIKYNLLNIKNKTNLDSNNEFSSAYRKNSLNSSNYSKNSVNFNKMNNSTNSISKPNNYISLMNIKNKKSNLDIETINKSKLQYLKIINIREKEHFGDVLMFLNEPSPLNLRVNSKNAEILLLSKTDVVKISSNFPNIWKRVNESSIFNLEQIKILIMRKLSIFCNSNNIKIKSLDYKKDIKTGQNKINYSLIPIPDSTQKGGLKHNINISKLNENDSEINENISSQNFENFNEKKNNYTIKEEESSEEGRTTSILTKEAKSPYENKTMSKKWNESINTSNQIEFFNNKNNKYSFKNITENRNQFLGHSRSYSNFQHKNKCDISNNFFKKSIETSLFKINTNNGNTIIDENNSPKYSKKKYLSKSPIKNKVFKFSVISSPEKITERQNFVEKSKINKRLISIPPFNLMQNNNNINLSCESGYINDEIYSNENFEIKIPDNDQNLIVNNYIESLEKSTSKCNDLPKRLLISDKKNLTINAIKKEVKQIDTNNLNSNNKFRNLKIYSMTGFEIKSSYDNINKFTKNGFISNDTLIEKTKIFLSKECGLLYHIKTKFANTSYHSPVLNRRKKSKSSIKLSKYVINNKIFEDTNSINNLSVVNDNGINSPPRFSKKLKKLGFIKTKKNSEKFLQNSSNDIRGLNKSFVNIKRNSTTFKENSIFPNNKNLTYINISNNSSPKKRKRKMDLSLDNLMNIKTRNKLDLITKNMNRDSQNLNNPNEFYADLFNNFYIQKIKKNGSIPKTKVAQNVIKNKNSKEREVDKIKN